MATISPYTSILMAGITGSGKSATGNSILGRKAFVSRGGMTSVTQNVQSEFGEIDDRKVKVVDTAGILDTNLSVKDSAKLVIKNMTDAVAASHNGFHAILLIINYTRLTKDHIRAVEILKGIFGPDFIRYHAILVITRGDEFRESEDNVSFQEWCNNQTGPMKQWLTECSGRAIMFDNKTPDIDIKMEQKRKLLNMIDQLSANGALYTSDIFNKAKELHKELLKKYEKPRLTDEAFMECSLITGLVQRTDFRNVEEAVNHFERLGPRAEALKQMITEQNCGTAAIKLAENLIHGIQDKNLDFYRQLQLKQASHSRQEEEAKRVLEATRLEEEERRKKKEKEEADEVIRKKEEERDQQKNEEMKIKKEEEKRKKEEEDKKRKDEEEKRKKEEEDKKRKDEEKKRKREEEDKKRKDEEEKRKKEEEKRQKEEDEKWKKIKEELEAIRIERTSYLGGLASTLIGPATSYVKSWFGW